MYVIYLAEGFIDGASDWVYYQSFTNLAQHIYGSREFKLINCLIHYLLGRAISISISISISSGLGLVLGLGLGLGLVLVLGLGLEKSY